MKVLAYVNLPFDIDLKKEKAYIVLKDGYYIQKVKMMPMPQKKELANYLPFEDYPQQIRFMDFVNGWNACLEEIDK